MFGEEALLYVFAPHYNHHIHPLLSNIEAIRVWMFHFLAKGLIMVHVDQGILAKVKNILPRRGEDTIDLRCSLAA